MGDINYCDTKIYKLKKKTMMMVNVILDIQQILIDLKMNGINQILNIIKK